MRTTKKAALILTSALTDGSVRFLSDKNFFESPVSTIDTLRLALNGSQAEWAVSLIHTLPKQIDRQLPTPIHLHDKRLTGASYHHGAEFMHAVAGPLVPLLRLCDVTENERESLIKTARKHTTMGEICYGVAHSVTARSLENRAPGEKNEKLQLVGIVVAKPVLYASAVKRIAALKQVHSALHYIASDDETFVSAVAIAAGLLRSSGSIHTRIVPSTMLEHSGVFIVSKNTYQKTLEHARYPTVYKEPFLR